MCRNYNSLHAPETTEGMRMLGGWAQWGITLMEGHLIEQVLLICKFAQNIGGWGKLPTCPSGSSGPAGHLLTFFLQI